MLSISTFTPYVHPWLTTGQYYYSRRTRVHLHYSCIKYIPQASTVTHVIAQRGSDRPISGSPGRKTKKKSTKLCKMCPLMYSCQEFSLVTSSTSLSPSRFALSSSLHLSLSFSTYDPLLPYLYFNSPPSTASILSFLFVILRRP